MPTANPRINVTLSPSIDTLVRRLAAVQGQSRSNVVRELLEASAPALGRAVALMEAAARAKPEALAGLARAMERAQGRVEGMLDGALDALGPSQEDLVSEAEAVRGRRPARYAAQAASGAGGRRRAEDPPASNRGVKSEKRGKVGGPSGRSRGVKP